MTYYYVIQRRATTKLLQPSYLYHTTIPYHTTMATAATATSTRRIAVIGGGWTGTLCAWSLAQQQPQRRLEPVVLESQATVGGRLAQAQVAWLRAADPQLAGLYNHIYASDASSGLRLVPSPSSQTTSPTTSNTTNTTTAARWGVLGSAGGGFLPSTVIPLRRTSPQNQQAVDNTTNTDTGDFLNFVEGRAGSTFAAETVDQNNLSETLLAQSNIQVQTGTTVTQAILQPDGWQLHVKQGTGENGENDGEADEILHFDGLVVATEQPSLAARIVQSIADAEAKAGGSPVLPKLQQLTQHLQRIRSHVPLYTWTGKLPPPAATGDHAAIPFDIVSVPGSPLIQFLSRQAEVGTRENVNNRTWTAVSTRAFVQEAMRAKLSEDTIQDALTTEVTRLVAPYYPNQTCPSPVDATVALTHRALPHETLEAPTHCLALQPWRLTIAGDYIYSSASHRSSLMMTPLEAAALSGLHAGEQTAAYFG